MMVNIIDYEFRTQDVKIKEDITFESMLLSYETLQGLKSSGFFKPSPIQLHGIPFGKCGFDLLLEAKSGTGKTAVFSIIALEKLDLSKNLQTVILAPTREIAMQISDVMKQIGSHYNGLTVEVVMGGLPVQDDILKFRRKVHIAVGSPGRLRHLIQDKYIDVTSVRLLVLDEADKLMESSFQADVNYIFSALPQQKQVIMSSATYPESSKTIIGNYVKNAQIICPDNNSVLLGIEHKIAVVQYNSNIVRQTQHRFKELLNMLSQKQFKQCLIFCNYQTRVVELHKMLIREKWPAEQLYGQQEQTDRLNALKTLQDYKCRILISTDLAARGIDASNIDLVINFEPPFEWQTYLHRMGRAGRFGSFGTVISIVNKGKELQKFKNLIESISLTIKLKEFWTDELFNFTENSNLIHPTGNSKSCSLEKIGMTNLNNTCEESFPTEFSCNDSDFTNKDDFKVFCRTFIESEIGTEIESFTELINSFENDAHELQEVSSQYRHIEIKTDIPKECLHFINSICGNNKNKSHENTRNVLTHLLENNMNNESPSIEAQSCFQENCITANKYESDRNNLQNQNSCELNKSDVIKTNLKPDQKDVDIDLSKLNKDLENKTETIDDNVDVSKIKSLGCRYLNQNEQSVNIPFECTNRSQVNTDAELSNAGLPTSFKSSKNKPLPKRRPGVNQSKNKTSQYHNDNENDTKARIYVDDFLENENCTNDKKFFMENENYSHVNYDRKSTSNRYSVFQNSRTSNRRYNYICWYTQLKNNMMQYEHSIYLYEMSKP